MMLFYQLTLCACSQKIQAIEPPKIVAPMHLVVDKQILYFTGSTNGELLEYVFYLDGEIQKLLIDRKAIKAWLETL